MFINSRIDGVYVFLSGKNMGVFKGVGYLEDIGEFFRIDEYKVYIWIVYLRFLINMSGWWGGVYLFILFDWLIVYNGEILLYGINYRYLEMFGYKCIFRIDIEVMVYFFDFFLRKYKFFVEIAVKVLAVLFWSVIDRQSE